MRTAFAFLTALSFALSACLLACRSAAPGSPARSDDAVGASPALGSSPVAVSSPMALEGTAYESAAKVSLPAQKPGEYEGLHNVYALSPNIVSGSEPHGRHALETIHGMGVRTIVSVDGKAPDVEEAAALGLRYVHIPIQYRGITDDELARLAKTFRELEGPFYVHCFHGKHRGPAAAAVGRIVVDGIPRESAIAEMRQYCGTSPKYEGLYRVIATGEIPGARETSGYAFGFDPVERVEGVAGLMVAISRAHDFVEEQSGRAWAADPDHPDVDALNEASKIAQAFEAACELKEVREDAEDFRTWFETSRVRSRELVQQLERFRAGDSQAGADATKTFKAVQQLCNDCHAVYRN